MSKNKIIFSALLLFLSQTLHAVNDELLFATAPTHSAEETTKLYTPIINFLSAKTGKKFKLDIPTNFIQYSKNIQDNKYDMAFDGPHLVAWRMESHQHMPIVRLPDQIKIVIAAREDSPLSSMEDLQYGVRVCAFVPPNLLTMSMLSYFSSPAKQPEIIRVQGFKNLMTCLKTKKGDAAVLRDKLWDKANKDGLTKGLKLIAKPSRGYPGRTFSVGPKIDPALRDKITNLLLSDEGRKAMGPLLERFKKKNAIKADPAEYEGLAELIRSVWGFQ
ncbi:MAG: phosphate/phosphite/phosphonate ABC transporter substrate-binding protein [Gammaproteobacteria bacterium]|nr:phosphate/phosphite/phosphonate ABC transporter substrate-binding protein [Gammaproteobacteria bacterium]